MDMEATKKGHIIFILKVLEWIGKASHTQLAHT